MADANKIRQQAKALKEAAEQIEKNAAQVARGTEKALEDLRKAKDALSALEAELGIAEGRPIQSFLQEIGAGFIQAQRALDDQTVDYLNGPHLMPSRFAMAKLNAELNFAVESDRKKGFNVIFFGASDSRREAQQQRVTFDIVSAPLPPEMVQAMYADGTKKAAGVLPAQTSDKVKAAWVLRSAIVLDTATREKIAEILKQYPGELKKAPGFVASNLDLKQTLILQSTALWVILFPGSDGVLEIVSVRRGEGDPEPRVDSSKSSAKLAQALAEVFAELLAEQQKLL